jgi:hypothetical protein
MKTYGEKRNHSRNQQFLTRQAGFKHSEFQGLAKSRRRDKKILHRLARRTASASFLKDE